MFPSNSGQTAIQSSCPYRELLRTIELSLGLPPMTHDDAALPMYNWFGTNPNLTAFQTVPPKIDVNEKNTQHASGRESCNRDEPGCGGQSADVRAQREWAFGGRTGNMYEAMKRTILKILPKTSQGLTVAETQERVIAHLPKELFPGGAKAGWWTKAVQARSGGARYCRTRENQATPLAQGMTRQLC
jgi:hypothetical protein